MEDQTALQARHQPVITLIGAGSQVFSFSMCTDICQTPELRGADIRLIDIDENRLETAFQVFKKVSDITGWGLKISKSTQRCDLLPGTDFVILSVADDRIERWDIDLAISRKYGIVETQGECGGPGGLSLTLRNIPLVLGIARDIERLAPNTVILNFTNPMTRVSHALSHYTSLTTVGLCHGLLGGQNMLSKLLERDVIVQSFGINHFTWVYDAVCKETGENVWEGALSKFLNTEVEGMAYSRDLAAIFGRIPVPDDTHMTDFTHHWRGDDNGLRAAYHLHPKDMAGYRDYERNFKERMGRYISGETNPMDDVHGLSGEGAIPIICALSGLTPVYEEIAANIPNKGYITNLPEGALVEVPAFISSNGIHGRRMGDLPKGINSLINHQLDIAELAVEAAVEGNANKALQALVIDPLITDIDMARSYLDDVLNAHRDVLLQFR
jgi:alpha-galactosidase